MGLHVSSVRGKVNVRGWLTRLSAVVLLVFVGVLTAVGAAAASTPTLTAFSTGLNSGAHPGGIAAGPDGNLWFTDGGTTPAIGEINPSTHAITEFSTGLNPGSAPDDIVAGPDGNLWFTDVGCLYSGTCAIGEINPATHAISEFSAGLASGGVPATIAAGPDGNLWFTDTACDSSVHGGACAIGEINPSTHAISEFTTGLPAQSEPDAITAGPDGNMWFTDYASPLQGHTSAIAEINPSTHTITAFTTGLNPYSVPEGIVTGPDGNLWFTDTGCDNHGTCAIGEINPSTHAISEFSTGLNSLSDPDAIAAGSDGNLWFTDTGCNVYGKTCAIGEINPSTHAISEFSTGLNAQNLPSGIAAGPDGNLWITLSTPAIGMITLGGSGTDTLSVSRAGSGSGTVTSSPVGIDCGSTCSATFNSGAEVTLTATPAAGSVFAGWSGAGCSGTGTCAATMSSDQAVTATFTATVTAAAVPVDLTAPVISGTPKAGHKLACSSGKWSNNPRSFAYRWSYDSTTIQGATASTYKLATLDEGLSLTCTVSATNAGGAGPPATSRSVKVAVPVVAKCPAATGRLTGTSLGLVRLGLTRAQARHAYTHSSNRGKQYQDFFCLTPIGVRVGYASPKLLKTLAKAERAQLENRVIWASTSSAYYAIDTIRVGATISAAGHHLKLTGPIHVGRNDWYLAPNGASTAVLKVRGGIIEEIGIGSKALTGGHKAQLAFLTSFT
jgi:streptogramin lyase